MNAANADPASLDHLRDIVLPSPIPLWPPAPGWYFLATFLLAGVVVVCWSLARRWHRDRYRRASLAELERLAVASRAPGEAEVALRELPELLKRAALAGFPREDVASLSGDAWLRFLDDTARTDKFTHGPGRVLAHLAYRPETNVSLGGDEIGRLFDASRDWIRAYRSTNVIEDAASEVDGKLR